MKEMRQKMTKEREIILAIRDLCGDISNKDYKIAFAPDWGGNSLTVMFPNGHTHVGDPDYTDDQFIEDLHNLLCNKAGLSLA